MSYTVKHVFSLHQHFSQNSVLSYVIVTLFHNVLHFSKVKILISCLTFFWIYSLIHWNSQIFYLAGVFLIHFILISYSDKGWGDWLEFKNHTDVCAFNSPCRILASAYTIGLYGQNVIVCTVPSGSPLQLSQVCFYSSWLNMLIVCIDVSSSSTYIIIVA